MEMLPMKTWYTDRDGWVELEDDVLSIVRQVRDLYHGKVTVEFLPDSSEPYAFVEHSGDGVDRLIFTCVELDGRALERLLRSDSASRSYVDPYDEAEKEQDRLQTERDRAILERTGELSERMAYAMKREGRAPRLPLTVGLNSGNREKVPQSAYRNR